MVSEQELDTLQRELSGTLVRPEQAADRTATQIDNGRVKFFPRVVVQANSVADVHVTLRFARRHELPLTVKGGDHSAIGYCLNSGGVVMDMSRMTAISLDREHRLVTMQIGARWRRAAAAAFQDPGDAHDPDHRQVEHRRRQARSPKSPPCMTSPSVSVRGNPSC